MNARVFLLILVTAFFMAAWNGDQAAMQAAIARRADKNQEAVVAVDAIAPATSQQSFAQPLLKTVSITKTQVGNEVHADLVPLPKGIAAGTYQAVNQAGVSIRLEVSEESTGQPRDFYMVDAENGDRWYLIRVTR